MLAPASGIIDGHSTLVSAYVKVVWCCSCVMLPVSCVMLRVCVLYEGTFFPRAVWLILNVLVGCGLLRCVDKQKLRLSVDLSRKE
ncbi:hypothetical protein V8F20_007519 [Naviculisporaceae sp. PSN 640]